MTDYDTDVLLWSERQGELLRRRAAGKLVRAAGELVNEAEVDWPNIAEKIETVGRIDLARIDRRVLQRLPKQVDDLAPQPVPDACPWPLDELLSDEP
jgi:hypothetical protein